MADSGLDHYIAGLEVIAAYTKYKPGTNPMTSIHLAHPSRNGVFAQGPLLSVLDYCRLHPFSPDLSDALTGATSAQSAVWET